MLKDNMLKRQDFISDVLDLYDYIDTLEIENQDLKNKLPTRRPKDKDITYIDVLMIKEGKEKIFHDVVRSWNRVECNYNEDTEQYDVTPFNKWVGRKIDKDYLPKVMSYDDFVTYFKYELSEMYKKEKEEALRKEKEETLWDHVSYCTQSIAFWRKRGGLSENNI